MAKCFTLKTLLDLDDEEGDERRIMAYLTEFAVCRWRVESGG